MGAKVTVGYNYHYKREILLDYVCSNCGTHNQCRDKLTATVFSNAVSYASNPLSEATRDFENTVKYLNNGPVPDRYKDAELRCHCSNCKKSEPWAMLEKKKVNSMLFWIPFCLMLVVAVSTEAIPGGMPKVLTWFLGAVPYLSLVIKNKLHTRKILKQVEALPKESLPVVSFLF